MCALLSASLLSADFLNLTNSIRWAESHGAGALHLDVMDGHFVNSITFGAPVIRAVKKTTTLPLDLHLMITNIEERLDEWLPLGCDWVTFHIEGVRHAHRVAQKIKEAGSRVGVAINPATSISALDAILPYVDLVLIMSVDPGAAGQKFLPPTIAKIASLRKSFLEITAGGAGGGDFGATPPLISVDGGVDGSVAPSLISAGSDILVSGSAFFKGCLAL